MPRLLTTLFSATVLALSGVTSGALGPAPAQAQSTSDQNMVGVQDMISWMKASAEVTVAMTATFQSEVMVDLMYLLSTDPIDISALDTQLTAFKEATDASRSIALQRYVALPEPTRWSIGGWSTNSLERKIYAVAVEAYEGLPDSMDALGGVSDRLIELIESVIDEENNFDLVTFAAETSTVTVEMVKSENRLIRGMANAIPKKSPNHRFHKVMIDVNNAMVAETGVLVSAAEDDPKRMMALRQKAGRAMLAALEDTPDLIATGRASIAGFDKNISDLLSGNPSPKEQEMLEAAREANQSFANAFDIEARIIEITQSNGLLYASDQANEDIDPLTVDNDAKFLMLINERQNQLLARMSLFE